MSSLSFNDNRNWDRRMAEIDSALSFRNSAACYITTVMRLKESIMGEQIGIGIAVAVVVGILGWLYKLAMFKKDEATVLEFLKKPKKGTNYNFRISEAIAAYTNLTIERVSNVCSRSQKVRRNTKEKESWCLRQQGNV